MFCKYSDEYIKDLFGEFRGYHLIEPEAEFITDYFGVKIPVRFVKYLAGREGERIEVSPFPGGSIRAGFMEYLAVVDSIRDLDSFYQMAEVGASYAPFSAIAGVLALRKGANKVVLRPVEASVSGTQAIKENLFVNNIFGPAVDVHIIQAAVSKHYQPLFFPDNDCTIDNGGKAQECWSRIDYRGADVPMMKINGIPLSFVIDIFPYGTPIDLLHIDIQGSESTSIPPAMKKITSRVKRVLLATHSRLIEGKMLELFSKMGWELIAEHACEFVFNTKLDSFEGMTTNDGTQYWQNPLWCNSEY